MSFFFFLLNFSIVLFPLSIELLSLYVLGIIKFHGEPNGREKQIKQLHIIMLWASAISFFAGIVVFEESIPLIIVSMLSTALGITPVVSMGICIYLLTAVFTIFVLNAIRISKRLDQRLSNTASATDYSTEYLPYP